MVPYMHKILVVTCEEDLQLQRLMEQRHLSERDAKLMIGAQMNLDQKAAMAQFVIENSGNLYDTKDQVSSVFYSNLPQFSSTNKCLSSNFSPGIQDPLQPVEVLFPLESSVSLRPHSRRCDGSGVLRLQEGHQTGQ